MNRKGRLEIFSGDFIPVIMGPTASGKSSLAMEIALASGGEIITADSMQLYRGLDIGTAKASPEDRARVPHHLIDRLDIQERSDVFRYCRDAEEAVGQIRARGKRPVMEGGSGLYLHAFLYGLDPLPADESLRKKLDEKFDSPEHFPELQAIMAAESPDDFARFGNHRRKLIRAYEVKRLSGHQITELQTNTARRPPRPGYRQFLLVWDRPVLRDRIFLRTKQMLASGWIEETEKMLALGLRETPTAWQALGYSRIAEYLEGRLSFRELTEKIAVATCQYARRQMTWFRNRHPDAVPVPMPLPED